MLVDRISYIASLCKDKEVLNIGCADVTRLHYAIETHSHLHLRLAKVSRRLIGVDISKDALEELAQYVDPSTLVCHDAENLEDLTHLGRFDVIVCGEIIEHLTCFGSMLEGARHLLKDGGLLIVTTPNALALKFALHAIFRGVDISSDYHTCLFSPKTLTQTLIRHGFRNVTLAWSQWVLPSRRSRVFSLITRPILKIRPHLADTLIATALKGR